jgi:hypothetical protein
MEKKTVVAYHEVRLLFQVDDVYRLALKWKASLFQPLKMCFHVFLCSTIFSYKGNIRNLIQISVLD